MLIIFMFLHGPRHRPGYNRRTSANTVSPAAAAMHRTRPLREEAARGCPGWRTAMAEAAVAIRSVRTTAAAEGGGRWESPAEKVVEARTREGEGGLDAPVCAEE